MNEDEYSVILGNGACHGDIAGKVKTAQIGFIRSVRDKDRVPKPRRSEPGKAPVQQDKRRKA